MSQINNLNFQIKKLAKKEQSYLKEEEELKRNIKEYMNKIKNIKIEKIKDPIICSLKGSVN